MIASNALWARRVFLTAGVYGLLVTVPQLFLEGRTSRDFPPTISHPEFYYGFVGAVVAWQVAFLLIGHDPARYRPLMLVSLIEKGVFAAAVPILYLQGRVHALLLSFAAIDLVLAVLFLKSWRVTRNAVTSPSVPTTRTLPVENRVAEDGATTEVLILDLGRALDEPTRTWNN